MGEANRPLFSIIVPTYERSAQLGDFCLPALTRLDYPRDKFEVILIDDGSTDPPTQVVENFQKQLQIRLIIQNHQGPAVARNKGAAAAVGNILAFTDDDCAPADDWLRQLERVFERSPRCAVGGKTVNYLSGNCYSAASQLLVDYLYEYYLVRSDVGLFFTSNNLAMPTDLFLSIGGFDESFQLGGEDRELCNRLSQLGFGLSYEPRILVYHAHNLFARTFIRQHFRYGRGAARFRQAMLMHSNRRVRVEPMSFYWNLIRSPGSLPGGGKKLLISLLLVASQLINAAGFFWEKSRPGLITRSGQRPG